MEFVVDDDVRALGKNELHEFWVVPLNNKKKDANHKKIWYMIQLHGLHFNIVPSCSRAAYHFSERSFD